MYKIGQVLWLIVDASKSIEPVQVTSKSTLESADGVTIHHNVVTASSRRQLCLEKSSDIPFETLVDAKKHLLDLAAGLVEKLALAATEKSKVFSAKEGGTPAQNADTQSPPELPLDDADEFPMVELPDGRMARVRISPDLQ